MKIAKSQLKQIIKEELNEVYSEKQRRWACAQTGDDFKGERSLSKEEAEEMCKGPMKEGRPLFERMTARDLAEWLAINPDYEVALQNPSSAQYYRVYEMWFDDEDEKANISVEPYHSEPLEEQDEWAGEEESADKVDYADGVKDAKDGKPIRKDASPAYLEGWAEGGGDA